MAIENEELEMECKACGHPVSDNYCGNCGLAANTKRISVHGLLHDIFHVFTHLDRGFGFTVKRLLLAPGHMQREYVEGDRIRHQKPFSMFLICATISAVTRYWIFNLLIKYFNAGDISEATFANEYMVLFQALFVPIHALLVFLVFYRSKYNYAEIGVFILYSTSMFLLFAAFITMLKLIWHQLDTAYIEFPILLFYNTITYINFFKNQSKLLVALKSLAIVAALFYLLQVCEDFFIKYVAS